MRRFTTSCLALVAVTVAVSGPASAQVAGADVSPDITLELGAFTAADEDVGRDDLAGTVTPIDLGAIPVNADVSLFHRLDDGDRLFGLDITVVLPGSIVVTPADVVRYDGVSYSLEFDGSAEGVPAGARLDALSSADGDLLLSFDTTVSLGALTASDEDIVDFDGTSFGLFLDGSVAGVPEEADVDALHFDVAGNQVFLSFDIAGTLDGMTFSDEDLLQFDLVGGNWSMSYDGSSEHPGWIAGDLDAAFVAFIAGLIFKDGFESI